MEPVDKHRFLGMLLNKQWGHSHAAQVRKQIARNSLFKECSVQEKLKIFVENAHDMMLYIIVFAA